MAEGFLTRSRARNWDEKLAADGWPGTIEPGGGCALTYSTSNELPFLISMLTTSALRGVGVGAGVGLGGAVGLPPSQAPRRSESRTALLVLATARSLGPGPPGVKAAIRYLESAHQERRRGAERRNAR